MKPGSRGFVFADRGEGTPAHGFYAENIDGDVVFHDYQRDPPVQYLTFGNGEVVERALDGTVTTVPDKWTRTWFYRVY
jgi:hypothetical protein